MIRASRRQFLKYSLLASALPSLPQARVAGAQAIDSPLTDLTAVEAVDAMRRGDVRAEDYAEALLAQHERWRSLNAFAVIRPDEVREAARAADRQRGAGRRPGLLHGLPIPVKDSVNTRALPTANGSAALQGWVPQRDATVLEPLFAEGAILMGKTNLDEISAGWSSRNATFGEVRNPYDLARTPGGSSGGSGAAVAARVAPLAIAEDTWGSIRVPSAFCGLAGLRPTFGRYPGRGLLGHSHGKFDQVGPVARSVADLALFDRVVTGEDAAPEPASLSGVRLGLARSFHFEGIDPAIEPLIEDALARLRDAGVEFVEAEFPEVMQEGSDVVRGIVGWEIPGVVDAFLKEHEVGVSLEELAAQAGPGVRALLTPERTSAGRVQYENLLRRRNAILAATRDHYRTHGLDAQVFPAALSVAPPADDPMADIDGERVGLATLVGRGVGLGSCAGLSCLVLPAGVHASGLPVGLEFDAPAGADRRLLALGLSFERVLGAVPAPAPPADDGVTPR